MAELDKKVEILRALLLTKEQFDKFFKNASELGNFSDIDKEAMEEFKKLYHLGKSQLEKVLAEIEKLEDEYSVMYYVTQLKNGPFKIDVEKVLNELHWTNAPDVMGIVVGSATSSITETPIEELKNVSTYNTPVPTLNKLPGFTFANANILDTAANGILSLGINGCLELEEKYEGTSRGKQGTPHGSYLVADTTTASWRKSIFSQILNVVKGVLGDKGYKMFAFRRDYKPYYESDNISKAKNHKVKRIIEVPLDQDDTPIEVETDLSGTVFESDKVREYTVVIEKDDKSFPKKLHTVEGQLGDLKKPKIKKLIKG